MKKEDIGDSMDEDELYACSCRIGIRGRIEEFIKAYRRQSNFGPFRWLFQLINWIFESIWESFKGVFMCFLGLFVGVPFLYSKFLLGVIAFGVMLGFIGFILGLR